VAEVYPVGIFGDVIVALKTTQASADVFASGDTIPSRAESSGTLDALQARADTVARTLERITRAFEAELVTAGALRDLRQSVSGMNRLVGQVQSAVDQQNRGLSATLSRVRSAVDSAEVGRTFTELRVAAANADSLMQRLSANTTQIQAILARLERGEGTAGQVLADSMLYRDARRLLSRADSLLTDLQKNPRKYFNFSIF
jgi:phospholipid/cholesterol/gamma-HCH transport system substrate-binding protein